jgi:hypothetical protein
MIYLKYMGLMEVYIMKINLDIDKIKFQH